MHFLMFYAELTGSTYVYSFLYISQLTVLIFKYILFSLNVFKLKLSIYELFHSGL